MGETANTDLLRSLLPSGGEGRLLPGLRIAADPAARVEERLEALRGLVAMVGTEHRRAALEVNNHIHTVYSFSPYTPSMAAWRAREAGLAVAGSVDHDSTGAALEMLAACAILGIGGTVGFEIRVSLRHSPFAEKKINNPDSRGIVYMTIQGLPKEALPEAEIFLRPIAKARGARNRRMTAALSGILAAAGYGGLDYERDILPLSKAAEGGSVTERHILAAAALSMTRRHGRGLSLVEGIASRLGIEAPPRVAGLLGDADNEYYNYDLLGLLKSGFLDRFFEQPGADECVPAAEAIAFARRVGAIPCYAYLGDVADSPTGDKKAEKFEDDYVDELVPWLAEAGFLAVTYMPPRNTKAQLRRLRELCVHHGLMEISGVDINSPRQSFNCPEVLEADMRPLIDSTWALVAHERLSGLDRDLGIFAPSGPLASLPISERIKRYAEAGRALDPFRPDDSALLARLARAWR